MNPSFGSFVSKRFMATLGSSASNVKYVRVGGYDIPKRLANRWKRKQQTLQSTSVLASRGHKDGGAGSAAAALAATAAAESAAAVAAAAAAASTTAAAAGAAVAAMSFKPIQQMSRPLAKAHFDILEAHIGGDAGLANGAGSSADVFRMCQLHYRLHGSVPGSWLLHILNRAGQPTSLNTTGDGELSETKTNAGEDQSGGQQAMRDWYLAVRAWQFFTTRNIPFSQTVCSDALIGASIRASAVSAIAKVLRGESPLARVPQLSPSLAGWQALLRAASPAQIPSVWSAMQASSAVEPSRKCYETALRQLASWSGDDGKPELPFVVSLAAQSNSGTARRIAAHIALVIGEPTVVSRVLTTAGNQADSQGFLEPADALLGALASLAAGEDDVGKAAALVQPHTPALSGESAERIILAFLETAERSALGPLAHKLFVGLEDHQLKLSPLCSEKLNELRGDGDDGDDAAKPEAE